jgi:hypothetical protein
MPRPALTRGGPECSYGLVMVHKVDDTKKHDELRPLEGASDHNSDTAIFSAQTLLD